MMKRVLTAALAVALLLTVGTTSAFAHGCGQGRGWRYADADGDGICDNCDTKGVCSVKPKAKTWAGHCHH